MNISGSGSIPFHAARAYGMRPTQPPAAAPAAGAITPTPKPGPTHQILAPSNPQTIARVQPTESLSDRHAKLSQSLEKLIAARVDQPMDFDGAANGAAQQVSQAVGQSSGQHLLPMYTRAADQIEAATSLHVGRSIDLKG